MRCAFSVHLPLVYRAQAACDAHNAVELPGARLKLAGCAMALQCGLIAHHDQPIMLHTRQDHIPVTQLLGKLPNCR